MGESASDPGVRAINILIVDDSAMMRTMIKRVAALADVPIGEVYEAANGAEAIRVLESHVIDAMFTDINMPVMTGKELLQEIERHPEWQHLVRVIISTDGSNARREEMSHLNVRCYVEKPFRPEVMRDVLSDVAGSEHAG
ncbi:MAG: response regulator [Vicinamibacterales bacterium]